MVAERHPGARPIEIAPILAAIPSYKEFQTGSELQTGSKQLVKDYPTLVSSGFLRLDENFGRSTEGRSIELMTVGKGKKKVMWVGTPHPNEPVGTLTIDFLSRYLCEHPEITEKLDTTFIFIKNADPDGLKLNKSWLKGGLDPLQYALGYYRPSEEKQVEWAFPVDYKTLHFHNPPPEAQALMEAFKKNKPDFYYSLHNCCFQNPYFNLSHKRTELFKPLEQVVTDQGLQLSIGKAEVPWMETYARGIYQIPSVQAKYDYFHTRGEDPLRIITGGAKSYDYLQEHVAPDSFSIESEVPYFTADALNDNTPSEMSQNDALVAGLNKRQNIVDFMNKHFTELESEKPLPDNRLKRSVAWIIDTMNKRLPSYREDAEKPEYQKEATKAQAYNAIQVASFYQVIWLGEVYRLAVQAGEIGRAEEIKQNIEGVIDDINEVSPIRSIPIQKLVAIQVGAGLVTQQHLSLAA